MNLVETLLIVAITAAVNGAVTWGVVSVKLDWLRRDVDLAHWRLDQLGAPPGWSVRRNQERQS